MDRLSEFITDQSNVRTTRLLAILDFAGGGPLKLSDMQNIAKEGGVRDVKAWNPSQVLSRSKGLAVLLPEGWKITSSGREALAKAGWQNRPSHVVDLVDDLNGAVAKIANEDRRSFVREAINCFTSENYRAAVVLSWSGAIAVMHDYAVNSILQQFNQEARRQNVIKRDLSTAADMQDIKDYTFLQLAHAVHMLDKNQKQELDSRRQFRNACGHPTALKISSRAVASHLEILILNVFNRF